MTLLAGYEKHPPARGVLHPGPLLWLRTIGWLLFLGILIAAMIGLASPVARHDFRFGTTPSGVLVQLGFVAASLALYAVAVWLGERRRPTELGLVRAAPDLLAGFALGAVMTAVIMGALIAIGAYEMTGPVAASPWGAVSLALQTGFLEELLLRAIVFRLIWRTFGLAPAFLVSAILFGALHLANPDASLLAAAAIAIEAGLLLPVLFLLTGRIWASVGVHFGWNFVLGYVFGTPVSGLSGKASVYVSKLTGDTSALISGGAFGPEASAPALGLAVVLFAAALFWLYRRNKSARGSVPAHLGDAQIEPQDGQQREGHDGQRP